MLDEQILTLITKCRNIIRTMDNKLEQRRFKEELENILEEYTKRMNIFKNDKSVLKLETKEGIQTEYIVKLEFLSDKLKKYEIIYFIESNFDKINNSLLKECDESKINHLKKIFKEIISKYESIKLKLELNEKEKIIKKIYAIFLNLIIAEVGLKNNSDLIDEVTINDNPYFEQALLNKIDQIKEDYNVELDKNISILSNTDLLNIIKKINLIKRSIEESKNPFDDTKKMSIVKKIKKAFEKDNQFKDDKKETVKITPLEFEKTTGIKINDHDKLVNYDISTIDFAGYEIANLDLSNTNAYIDPQKVKYKYFIGCNLENVDLSKADFTGVNISGANLRNTNAHIDPQRVQKKNLFNCNLEGLNLSEADFTEVNMVGVNLKNTNAYIDPQRVQEKNLSSCNLEGLDLSKADFTGVNISYANLTKTNAYIDPQKVQRKDLHNCNLEGLDLSKANFIEVDISGSNLKNTNAYIDPQKVQRKDLSNSKLEGLDLSKADFTEVDISGANLKKTNAKIVSEIRKSFIDSDEEFSNYYGGEDHYSAKSLENCNLEGLDLTSFDFKKVYIKGANLKDTNAKIDPQLLWKDNKKRLTLCCCNLEGLNFENADFRGVDLTKTNFTNCNLNGVIFDYSYEELVEKYQVILPEYIVENISKSSKQK